jgi:hypothetical protein
VSELHFSWSRPRSTARKADAKRVSLLRPNADRAACARTSSRNRITAATFGKRPGKGEPRQALRARGRAAYPTANVAMAEATRSPPRARLRSSGTTPQGDHARPGIGDTASLADAFDLRTLLRGLGLACAIAARGLASADVPRRLRACTGRASARSCCRVERPIPAHHRAFGNAFFHSPPATCTLPLRSLNVGESSFSAASTNSRIARPL